MQIAVSQVMDTLTIYVNDRMAQFTEAEGRALTIELNDHFAKQARFRSQLAAQPTDLNNDVDN